MSASGKSDETIQLPALEDIDKAIEKAMEADLESDSPGVWTTHILKAVNRKKPDSDRVVVYPCRRRRRSEYLVDLAWSIEENVTDWPAYRGLALALECEWGGDEDALWEDFIKLADVRANLKVFVGALRRDPYEKRGCLLDAWASFLSNHLHVPECEKILVALCEKKESKTAKHGSWIVDRKGKVTTLRNG